MIIMKRLLKTRVQISVNDRRNPLQIGVSSILVIFRQQKYKNLLDQEMITDYSTGITRISSKITSIHRKSVTPCSWIEFDVSLLLIGSKEMMWFFCFIGLIINFAGAIHEKRSLLDTFLKSLFKDEKQEEGILLKPNATLTRADPGFPLGGVRTF